ncbi:hypothetical protein SCYAM73S_05502 [Streptomyces cyaneofuscatus]
MLELVRYLAPGFAVVAFTVHAVVSTRQRRKEFALLRAIGVRAGHLSTLLGAEQLGLTLFAVVRGRSWAWPWYRRYCPGHRGRQREGPLARCRWSSPGAWWH